MKAKFAEFVFPDVWRIREEAESIIVESVVDSAIKPKAWLETEMLNWEGQSSLRRLRA